MSMSLTEAIAKAQEVLGPKANVEIDDGALTGAQRVLALKVAREAREGFEALQKALKKRRADFPCGDVECERLIGDVALARERMDETKATAFRSRVCVVVKGPFRSSPAQGDDFAEAFARLNIGQPGTHPKGEA